jgi:exosortase
MSTNTPTELDASLADAPSSPAVAAEVSSDSTAQPHPAWRWFWLGLLLCTVPLLIPYFSGLWANATYRYFPFAIGAVVWLAYGRSDGHFYPPRGVFSWLAVSFAMLLVVMATILHFSWFASVALVLVCTAMLYAMRGPDDRTLLVLALPLFTLIQLKRADQLLVLSLQRTTTWMSSVLLDALAVPHAVANNVIQLADRELFVAEACSGIQSVFTLSFLALLVVAWRRRRIWMAPLYLVIACLLAVFANTIRVTVVAVAANLYQADLAEGWPHELLGYVALTVAFGFLLSFDYLIATLLHRVPQESEFNPFIAGWNYLSLRPLEEQSGRGTRRDVAELWQRDQRSSVFRFSQRWIGDPKVRIGFAALVAVLFLASASQLVISRRPLNLVSGSESLVFDPPQDLLDQTLDGLTVVKHVPNRNYEIPGLGANSDVWECESDDLKVQFVLSQPYQGWHELCDCYERLQWTLVDRHIRSPEELNDLQVEARSPDATRATYVLARFKRNPSQYGYLIFAGLGSDGTFVDAPDSLTAFTHRVWNRIDTTGVWEQNEVIMLQMWLATPEKLSAKRVQQLEREFLAARGRIADAIAENAGRELPRQASADRPSNLSPLAANRPDLDGGQAKEAR